MCNKMVKEVKVFNPNVKKEDILLMNSPVIKIENEQGKNIRIRVKNSNKVYVCKCIFFSVPIAVINQIEITSISESKKLIFDNQ